MKEEKELHLMPQLQGVVCLTEAEQKIIDDAKYAHLCRFKDVAFDQELYDSIISALSNVSLGLIQNAPYYLRKAADRANYLMGDMK